MHFGLYLVEHGMISASQFVTALEAQIASRPQLGALAIEAGKLSVKQVFQILRTQSDMPQEKFGELAIAAGLLNEEELACLLYHQSIQVTPMGQIISDMGFASKEDVQDHYAEYRALSQPEDQKELATAS